MRNPFFPAIACFPANFFLNRYSSILEKWSKKPRCFPALVGAVTSPHHCGDRAATEINSETYKLISQAVDSIPDADGLHRLLVGSRASMPRYNGRLLSSSDLLDPDSVSFVLIYLEGQQDNPRLERLNSMLCSIAGRCPAAESLATQIQSGYNRSVLVGIKLTDFFLPLLTSGLSKTQEHHRYSQLCKTVLVRYAADYVGHNPPPAGNPALLPRQISVCHPSCTDCKDLNRFLVDRNVVQETFRAAQHRRTHMEQMLFRSSNALTGPQRMLVLETLRDRSPHGLRVTKVQGEILKRRDEWNDRCALATRAISCVAGEAVLRNLLGEEQYQWLLQRIRPLDDSDPGLEERGSTGLIVNYSVGQKRRADVIDLTRTCSS